MPPRAAVCLICSSPSRLRSPVRFRSMNLETNCLCCYLALPVRLQWPGELMLCECVNACVGSSEPGGGGLV